MFSWCSPCIWLSNWKELLLFEQPWKRISGFEPSLEMIDSRYLTFSTASNLLSWSLFGSHQDCLSSLTSCQDQSLFCIFWWLCQEIYQNISFFFLCNIYNNVKLVISCPPMLTLPSWPFCALLMILSRMILKRFSESRHCRTPTKVLNHSPVLQLNSTALCALLQLGAPIENVSSSMRKMHRIRFSSRACAKSHPGNCSTLIPSIVSNDSISGELRPWLDYANVKALIRLRDARADLGLHCTHMPENTFLHSAAHIQMNICVKVTRRDKGIVSAHTSHIRTNT